MKKLEFDSYEYLCTSKFAMIMEDMGYIRPMLYTLGTNDKSKTEILNDT